MALRVFQSSDIGVGPNICSSVATGLLRQLRAAGGCSLSPGGVLAPGEKAETPLQYNCRRLHTPSALAQDTQEHSPR